MGNEGIIDKWLKILEATDSTEEFYVLLSQYSESEQKDLLEIFSQIMQDELAFTCTLYNKKNGKDIKVTPITTLKDD